MGWLRFCKRFLRFACLFAGNSPLLMTSDQYESDKIGVKSKGLKRLKSEIGDF